MENKNFLDTISKSTIETAKSLLGMRLLWKRDGETQILGNIVETEAYLGTLDSACHSFNGKRTPRNESMYLSSGHWYVYQIHGHFMLNLVTMGENEPEAVLIRAVQSHIPTMDGSGPGKLTKAFGITKALDGQLFTDSTLTLETDKIPKEIVSRKRIGITCTDEWRDEPLGFYVKGNSQVSRISKKEILQDDLKTWKE
ncbi:DNA-3-methyladenine glycosylase [Lactococcus garvieae]|uniref:DNA-3-methyladenine glycosylase n=1 Tax=Lactococcus garvieae TaxID=1363 RepID=UPI0009C161C1|nr:DNA-3-methyladenine glycosylase [Lactococcus garvieae]